MTGNLTRSIRNALLAGIAGLVAWPALAADVRAITRTLLRKPCSRCASPIAVLLEADDSITLLAPKKLFAARKSSSRNDSMNKGRNSAR